MVRVNIGQPAGRLCPSACMTSRRHSTARGFMAAMVRFVDFSLRHTFDTCFFAPLSEMPRSRPICLLESRRRRPPPTITWRRATPTRARSPR